MQYLPLFILCAMFLFTFCSHETVEGVDLPLDNLSDISLTGSQTQAIASIIGTDPNLLYEVVDPINVHPTGNVMADSTGMFVDVPFGGYGQQQHFGDNTALSNQHHFQELEQVVAPPASSLVHGVPAIDNWPGELGYCVEFNKSQDKTKATPWVVS